MVCGLWKYNWCWLFLCVCFFTYSVCVCICIKFFKKSGLQRKGERSWIHCSRHRGTWWAGMGQAGVGGWKLPPDLPPPTNGHRPRTQTDREQGASPVLQSWAAVWHVRLAFEAGWWDRIRVYRGTCLASTCGPHCFEGLWDSVFPFGEVLEVFAWLPGVDRLIFCMHLSVHLSVFLSFAQESAKVPHLQLCVPRSRHSLMGSGPWGQRSPGTWSWSDIWQCQVISGFQNKPGKGRGPLETQIASMWNLEGTQATTIPADARPGHLGPRYPPSLIGHWGRAMMAPARVQPLYFLREVDWNIYAKMGVALRCVKC